MQENWAERKTLRCIAFIFLCFFVSSTGWMAWSHHLREFISAQRTDLMTMVIGYSLQAAGIALYALIRRGAAIRKQKEAEDVPGWPEGQRTQDRKKDAVIYAALAIHMAVMVPAVISPQPAGTLIFGFLMNLFCGILAGSYLEMLASEIRKERKAAAFSAGYGLAILCSFLISLMQDIYYSEYVLLICLVGTAAAAVVYRAAGKRTVPECVSKVKILEKSSFGKWRKELLTAGILVFLFSTVNSSGFAFPSADVGKIVSVELFRMIYAAGLFAAGIVTDRSRLDGAVLALSGLMIPFIILALRAESVSAVVFWALAYFAFGFYAVYRIVVFSDLASDTGRTILAGFGLMIGRIGDAAGEVLCVALEEHTTLMVCLTAVLFLLAVFVFFKGYSLFYGTKTVQEESEEERFFRFSSEHDLSSRERDVLRRILEEKTNAEIAGLLYISENTVKFHVRNILQKTGSKNKNELIRLFRSRS